MKNRETSCKKYKFLPTSKVDVVTAGVSVEKPLCSAETWHLGGSGSEWGFVMYQKKVMVAWSQFFLLVWFWFVKANYCTSHNNLWKIRWQESYTLLGSWSQLDYFDLISSYTTLWIPHWLPILNNSTGPHDPPGQPFHTHSYGILSCSPGWGAIWNLKHQQYFHFMIW